MWRWAGLAFRRGGSAPPWWQDRRLAREIKKYQLNQCRVMDEGRLAVESKAGIYSIFDYQSIRHKESNMLRYVFSAQPWRRRLLAVLLLPATAVAVNAGASAFVPSVAQASPADREQGFDHGKQDGYADGKRDGYRNAYKASYKVGFEDSTQGYFSRSDYRKGYVDGYPIGYESGYRDGRRAGRRDGYQDGVSDGSDFRDDLRRQMHDCMRRGTC
jgi:hypothetical protein